MGILIEEINKYDNEIEAKEQRKLELLHQVDQLEQECSELSNKKNNLILFVYNDSNNRKQLIEKIKDLGFKKKKIELVEELFSNFTQDNIDKEKVELIVEAEKFVDDFSTYSKKINSQSKKGRAKTIIDMFSSESEGNR